MIAASLDSIGYRSSGVLSTWNLSRGISVSSNGSGTPSHPVGVGGTMNWPQVGAGIIVVVNVSVALRYGLFVFPA